MRRDAFVVSPISRGCTTSLAKKVRRESRDERAAPSVDRNDQARPAPAARTAVKTRAHAVTALRVVAYSASPGPSTKGRRRGFGLFRLAALAAVVLAGVTATTCLASAASYTVAGSNLVATLRYTGSNVLTRNLRLSVSWSGRVLYSQPVRSRWCGTHCWPDSFAVGAPALRLVRLAPDATPEIVLALYSGGAHCCFIDQVFSLAPGSHAVRKSEFNFGDPGARLAPIGVGASSYFVTADDAFAYAFTDFAASGLPLKIVSFSNGAFRDVTNSFPHLLAADARRWQLAFRAMASSHYDNTVGVVAAWAADEYRLGRVAGVDHFLAVQVGAGRLNSAMDPAHRSGQRFVADLRTFLQHHGYVR